MAMAIRWWPGSGAVGRWYGGLFQSEPISIFWQTWNLVQSMVEWERNRNKPYTITISLEGPQDGLDNFKSSDNPNGLIIEHTIVCSVASNSLANL
jgi:hypothetical protein